MYESEVHRKYTARMSRLDAVIDLLQLNTKQHTNFSASIGIESGNTHWRSYNVKIAGNPASTCQ